MGNKEDCFSCFLHLLKTTETLSLKSNITDGESFIDDQDVRVSIHSRCKSKPDIHAAGVGADRVLNKLADAGKLDDILETILNLFSGNTQQCRIQINILPTGKRGIKARAELQQRSQPAAHRYCAPRWSKRTAYHLKQGGFSGTVWADNPDRLSRSDLKADVIQCRKDRMVGAPTDRIHLADPVDRPAVNSVILAQPRYTD